MNYALGYRHVLGTGVKVDLLLHWQLRRASAEASFALAERAVEGVQSADWPWTCSTTFPVLQRVGMWKTSRPEDEGCHVPDLRVETPGGVQESVALSEQNQWRNSHRSSTEHIRCMHGSEKQIGELVEWIGGLLAIGATGHC